jgi:hypothetical protein
MHGINWGRKLNTYINQLSGNDILTHHVVLCIAVGMTPLHFMYVSNYTVVDILTVSNANLCVLLDRCPGFEFFRVNIMAVLARRFVSDEVLLYELLQENKIVIFMKANIVVTVK